MPIIAKNSGTDFTPAPEGLWPAVCIDVVDKGMVASKNPAYPPRHMIQIRWVLDAEPALESGLPHMAVRSFGLSLGEKSHLRPFLEAWRGKKFTDQELAGFDVEKLIGANCQLQIIHNLYQGKTYGNVQSVVSLGRGMTKMAVPKDYVRECNRPGYQAPDQPEEPVEEEIDYGAIDDSDIPF